MRQWDIEKHVPDFPFLIRESMIGMHAASHILFVVLYSHDAYKKKGEKMNVISFYISVLNALRWPRNPHIHPLPQSLFLSWVLPLYRECSKYYTVTNHPCYNILSSEGSHSDSTKPLWCHRVEGIVHFDLLRGELWRHLSASLCSSPHTPPLTSPVFLPLAPSGERL